MLDRRPTRRNTCKVSHKQSAQKNDSNASNAKSSAEYNQIYSIMEQFNRSTFIAKSMMQPGLHFQLKNQGSLYQVQVTIPTHRVSEQLELYHWRIINRQELISFQWIKAEPFNCQEALITIKITKKLTTLDDIKQIRGNYIPKNIGKIFSSYELLYKKFGPFEVKPRMIAFDGFYQPFVWMNEDHSKNQYKRDFISEAQFTTNILSILMKYSQKFQNGQMLYYFCEVQGQGYGLREMAQIFKEFQDKEDEMKRSKMHSSHSSTTLSFSKQLKTKNTNKTKRNIKNTNHLNKEVYHSHFKDEKNSKRPTLSRTASDHIGSSYQKRTIPHSQPQLYKYHENEVTIGLLTEMEQSFYFADGEVREKMLPVFEIREEFFVSIDLGEEENDQEEIVQLQKLDKFKFLLTKSIISESTI